MYYYFDYEEPVFRPPSEARSLIFQITIGCSQNDCTFCGMYKMKAFRCRKVEEVLTDIRKIPADHRRYVQRIFLADGDALVFPQVGLIAILDALAESFPNLTRIGIYASPNSLRTKTVEELRVLREKKLRILYFGLESGDDKTLQQVKKGYTSAEMLEQCRKAQDAGMKLSVTAILGLAGQQRSSDHARATAEWINHLSPEYFSLLTLFPRGNEDFFRDITRQSRGEILEEALEIVQALNPKRTILRSNHASNFLNLAGNYPKDRQRLIDDVEAAITTARQQPDWYNQVPDYSEEHF
jgi:radical SAM superfamily enzyme YgiQ (UPF0313 family)